MSPKRFPALQRERLEAIARSLDVYLSVGMAEKARREVPHCPGRYWAGGVHGQIPEAPSHGGEQSAVSRPARHSLSSMSMGFASGSISALTGDMRTRSWP